MGAGVETDCTAPPRINRASAAQYCWSVVIAAVIKIINLTYLRRSRRRRPKPAASIDDMSLHPVSQSVSGLSPFIRRV